MSQLLDKAQQKAIEHAAMDAGADSWRHCRLAMVDGDEIVGYPAFSRADLAELARLYSPAPVSPASDLLKEAVGLLAASIDLMTDDYQDCASHRAKTRAFLSKVEERGHD